jgi:hypothetical protein
MPTKEELIRDNQELKSRLELAEKWMAREVAGSLQRIRQWELKKSQRKHFENAFESEKLDLMTRKIMGEYGHILEKAPKYTLERLIDAEIYWETLQRYPHMDWLPIILAYQKIFDAWIEYALVAPWREQAKGKKFVSSSQLLEKDLENIIKKNYTLSIGRLYQAVTLIRQKKSLPQSISDFIAYNSSILHFLARGDIFSIFSELIEFEVFSKKRHEKKVSYSDVRQIRNIIVEWCFFRQLFSEVS